MPETRKRALLIGLTHYAWSDAYAQPLNLGGGANDAQALAAVLRKNFGFAADDLHLLLSEPETPPERQATAAKEAKAALAEAMKDCRGAATDRKACEKEARDQYRAD